MQGDRWSAKPVFVNQCLGVGLNQPGLEVVEEYFLPEKAIAMRNQQFGQESAGMEGWENEYPADVWREELSVVQKIGWSFKSCGYAALL